MSDIECPSIQRLFSYSGTNELQSLVFKYRSSASILHMCTKSWEIVTTYHWYLNTLTKEEYENVDEDSRIGRDKNKIEEFAEFGNNISYKFENSNYDAKKFIEVGKTMINRKEFYTSLYDGLLDEEGEVGTLFDTLKSIIELVERKLNAYNELYGFKK